MGPKVRLPVTDSFDRWRSILRALEHATAAYRANPGSVEALSVYADSFMFSTSSKGIMAQAVTGNYVVSGF